LANLGLHGGEYASANEIDIAVAKREHLSNGAAPEIIEITPQAPAEAIKAPSSEQIGWATMVAAVETFLPSCANVEGLKAFWERNLPAINELRDNSPKEFASVKAMFAARKMFLNKEEK